MLRGTVSAARDPAPKPERPAKAPPKRARPAKRKPSDLELVEARIAETEARVEDLERTLADDWTNMDVLSAHRAARDELKALLERWEELFDSAQTPAP